MAIRLLSVAVGIFFFACGPAGGGGGTGDGSGAGGGSGASFPKTVKLQGTLEVTTRSYDRPGGNVIGSSTSKGSFSGTSTSSDLGPLLRYSFDLPFTVSGTQAVTDVTLSPRECTRTISGSTGSNLQLVVGSPTSGGVVAQLWGSIGTTEDGTCANGGNVTSGFALTMPNADCPDPAVRVISDAKWLVVSGDPRTGFDFSQDITCDRSTVKINVSVEGL